MKTYTAREFADLDKEYLWTQKNRKIIIQFDDQKVECRWREAVLSSYCWKIHRDHPSLPLLSKYLIKAPVTKGSVNKMWETILFDIHNLHDELELDQRKISIIIICEINKLFNDVTRYLVPYTTSANARELREIIHHPVMEVIYAKLNSKQGSASQHALIKECNKLADEFIRNHPDMADNQFCRDLKMGLIDGRQFLQVVLARGYTEEINQQQHKDPITTGYGRGIHNMQWSAQVSRDASIATLQAKDPVQRSDYLNRRLQMMVAIIRNVYPGDCGTTETLPWRVDKKDLTSLAGVYYYDDDNVLREVHEKDTHLIGKTIQIRSVPLCHHLHKNGCCQTCLGTISSYIPEYYAIGHISVINALGAFVQLSLSAKHLIVSREQIIFVLDSTTAKYIKFPKADNQNDLILQPKVVNSGHDVEFIFNIKDLTFLSDIANGVPLDSIQITSASAISECQISITNKAGDNLRDVITVSDIGRKSSLSKEFIRYILENRGVMSTVRSAVKVDLSGWDHKLPIFNIPYKITSVKDFMRKFESTIKTGSEKYAIDANNPVGIADMMRLCYNIVRECVDIPVSHLGVIIASLLIRDKSALDYRLPVPGGPRQFDVMGNIYGFRSISQMMAYEQRLRYLDLPAMVMTKVRPDHPFDSIYFIGEMDTYADVREAERLGVYPKDILPDYSGK